VDTEYSYIHIQHFRKVRIRTESDKTVKLHSQSFDVWNLFLKKVSCPQAKSEHQQTTSNLISNLKVLTFVIFNHKESKEASHIV
jgi:hypothetical protein